jgi:hypothetical protein
LRSLGIRSSTAPAQVSKIRSVSVTLRQTLGLSWQWAARVWLSSSRSISRWAAKPIISRNKSASGGVHELAQVHHIVGHRWLLEFGLVSANRPYRRIIDDTAKLPGRYGLFEGARADGFALPSYTINGDTTVPSLNVRRPTA